MGTITDAVKNAKYRDALIAQAVKCAKQLDDLQDEKNLANISRELRLILAALGLDEIADTTDVVGSLQDSVNAKTSKDNQ